MAICEGRFVPIEVHALPIQARGPMDTNNLSATLWHRDAQDFGAPELHPGSKGIAFNANYLVADQVMIFARGGWSDGWVIEKNATVGLGWRPGRAPSDLIGFGFGWAEPSNEFLPLQKTAEAFYRFQLTQNLALTPDVQFITNPSLDLLTDTLWVFSVRTRVTF